MLSKTLQDALNTQINREFYSSYLYLAMAAYADDNALPGTAHWLRVQSGEEWGHALKMYHYVVDRGGRVTLGAIEQPPVEYGSAIELFNKVSEHEQKVSAWVNELYGQSLKEADYASQAFLIFFVTEQVEEEKSVRDVLEQLKAVGDKSSSILFIDRHLAKRV